MQQVERRLFGLLTERPPGASGNFQRLGDLGIRLRDGQLQLDEDKLRAALQDHPDELAAFFADEDSGLAVLMKDQLDGITDTDGLIDRRDSTLQRQKEQMADRVDALNERLDAKRSQLLRKFQNMESALAQLQTQQAAIAQLSSLAGSYSLLGGGSSGA